MARGYCTAVRSAVSRLAFEPTRLRSGELASRLRCIFGNPFSSARFDAAWRTQTVVLLAREMYQTRDFSPMGVLADALEEAGCADGAVLAHYRRPDPHVRGCHVMDLVLGKE